MAHDGKCVQMKSGCVRCRLQRIDCLSLRDIKKIYACVRYKTFFINYEDGRLIFFKFERGVQKIQPRLFPHNKYIQSFCWFSGTGEGANREDGLPRFCFLTNTRNLALYDIPSHDDQPRLQQEITGLPQLINGYQEAEEMDIVSYQDAYIILRVDMCLVSLQWNGQIQLLWQIPFNLEDRDAHIFQVCDKTVSIILMNTKMLLFYSTLTGKLMQEIDLKMLLDNVGIDKLKWIEVTKDLAAIVTMDSGFNITWTPISEYITAFPDSTKVKSSPPCKKMSTSSSWGCQTSAFDDIMWKDILSSMHAKYARSATCQQTVSSPPLWNITGFQRKKSSVDRDKKLVGLPQLFQELRMMEVCIGSGVVTFVLEGENELVLCICNVEAKTCIIERFPVNHKIILSASAAYPHLILTETHIDCLVTDSRVGQEDFVSMVMLYGGAGITDVLCHLNNWGRCSIPINALDVALKHHQFDTVSFFLKSKEYLFSGSKGTEMASPTTSGSVSLSWTSRTCHQDSLNQLEPALDLLLKTVQDNMQEKQPFAQQLSNITLDFLYGLLHDAENVSKDFAETEEFNLERQDLSIVKVRLLDLIGQLRGNMVKMRLGQSRSQKEDMVDSASVKEDWEGNDIQEAMETAVLRNKIPQLQAHLCDKSLSDSAQFNSLQQIMMLKVIGYFTNKQNVRGVTLLSKLGMDIDKKLWEIALYAQGDLLTSILEELEKRITLEAKKKEWIAFLWSLQRHYPCQNYTDALPLVANPKKIGDVMHFPTSGKKKYDLVIDCDDISTSLKESSDANSTDNDISCGGYVQVLLDWLQWWDKATQKCILLECSIGKKNHLFDHGDKQLMWEYLLSHNRLDLLAPWLEESLCQQVMLSPISHLTEILGRVPSQFVEQITGCCKYVGESLLQIFSRHGIFSAHVLSDFPELLWWLNYSGGALTIPHPLKQCVFLNVDHFHMEMIRYCVDHNFPTYLWQYFHIHQINSELLLCAYPDSEGECTWMNLFYLFYKLSFDPKSIETFYKASLANSSVVCRSEVTSIAQLLEQDHLFAALATFMYSSRLLQHTTSDEKTCAALEGFSSAKFEKLLKPYSKLHAALFPASSTETPTNDISVYQLLLGGAPFDPCKLFGWQTTNSLVAKEYQNQLPYFSLPAFVSKFAYTERIRYTYFLKQGRPSFAYVSFLAEELESSGMTIANQRLRRAFGTAIWMGVRNLHNTEVSTACVVFLELLGQDSIVLRTYLQVGQEILHQRNSAVKGSNEHKKEQISQNEHNIVDLLQSCIKSKRRLAGKVLHELEGAIMEGLDRSRTSHTSFRAAQRWTVAILFCHVTCFSLSTCFLEACAHDNQWLPFLWFSQMHQYPKEQMQGILHHFKSKYLQEHLYYVIENAQAKSLDVPEGKAKPEGNTKISDHRLTLYSKIGVTKGTDNRSDSSGESDDETGLPDRLMDAQSSDDDDDDDLFVSKEAAADDIFGVLFAAQATRCPWKSLLLQSVVLQNPLLAELAVCYDDSLRLPCLIGWLISMMDGTEHAQFLENYGKAVGKWNLSVLSSAITVYVKKKWMSTLVVGFDIFQTSCPLLPFLKFCAQCTERKNYSLCKALLGEFKDVIYTHCHGKPSDEPEVLQGILVDCTWLEQTAADILKQILCSCENACDTLQILKLLDTENIALVFSFDVPDFGKLCRMLQIVLSAEIYVDRFSVLLSPDTAGFNDMCEGFIQSLIVQRLFNDARSLAHLTGLSTEHITLQQLEWEKRNIRDTLIWQSRLAREKFWKRALSLFTEYHMAIDTVVKFFKMEVAGETDAGEKAFIYQLCLDAVAHSDANYETDDIRHQMWLCKIHEKIEEKKNVESCPDKVEDIFSVMESATVDDHIDRDQLVQLGKMPQSHDKPSVLSAEEQEALGEWIGQLLDKGRIAESCKVAAIFSFYSQNLAIILTCIRLSRGCITVEDMNKEMKDIVTKEPPKHRTSISSSISLLRTASSISLSSKVPSALDFLPPEKEQITLTMEQLLRHCGNGRLSCLRIITAYKIAAILDTSYEAVISSEEFVTLESLLKTECSERFKLASDYLSTSCLTNTEVAVFLADSILHACKQHFEVPFGDVAERDMMTKYSNLLFNPTESPEVFAQFVKLCPDPSQLGDSLLDALASLDSGTGEISKSALSVQIELVVYAHECYTASCNMEGISNVLRAARILTDCLETAEEFPLMMRLLTGVGRYGEMTFIFDALQQNHQFELLLKKGTEKENKLKMSILDYLKRYHPSDRDTYTMVALNFTMFREIAQMLEERAYKLLDELKCKPLENSSDIQSTLQKTMQYFLDAAESYVKEKCFRHAQTCVQQARLVALQQHHLSSGVQLINLSTDGATSLIGRLPKFSEAYIVCEAYGRRNSWSLAICNFVIIKGDFRYLQELRAHVQLTPNLITDAVEQYRQMGNELSENLGNIKKLLPFCKDIKMQYKLAQEMDLKDFLLTLEKGDSGNYLQDLISTAM